MKGAGKGDGVVVNAGGGVEGDREGMCIIFSSIFISCSPAEWTLISSFLC